jgi:hypothetical protein
VWPRRLSGASGTGDTPVRVRGGDLLWGMMYVAMLAFTLARHSMRATVRGLANSRYS